MYRQACRELRKEARAGMVSMIVSTSGASTTCAAPRRPASTGAPSIHLHAACAAARPVGVLPCLAFNLRVHGIPHQLCGNLAKRILCALYAARLLSPQQSTWARKCGRKGPEGGGEGGTLDLRSMRSRDTMDDTTV